MSLTINEVRVPVPLQRARKVRNAILSNGDSQSVSAAGAVAPENAVVYIQPTEAAMALTLADGSVSGETMRLVMTTQSDSTYTAVLTPANLTGGTTITFDAVDEYAVLIWDGVGGAWVVRAGDATVA